MTIKSQVYNDYKTHVIKRITTKLGIDLNKHDPDTIMSTLSSAINQGTYLTKGNEKNRKIYLVKAFKKNMCVVYDYKHNVVITVWP